MLHLDAGIDLDEVVAALAVDEELERAHVLVAGRDRGPDGGLGELRAGGIVEGRAGCFLHDLLVAPLHGAVALTDMHAVTVGIDDDLDLDVAGALQPLLEVQRVITEGGASLGAADRERLLQLAWRAHHAHALAAAARRGLDEQRVADALRLGEGMRVVAQHAVRAGHDGQPVTGQQLARAGLGGEALQHLGRWPDEDEVVGPRHLREAVVLGEEAVAGMDGIAAADQGGRDHCRRGQVGARRFGRADADGLVGHQHRARIRDRLRCGPRPLRYPGCDRRAGCARRSRRGWR